MKWSNLPHRLLSDGSIFFLRETPKEMPGWYASKNIYRRIVPPCIHRGKVEAKCCRGGTVPSCDGKQISYNQCYDCTKPKI